MATPVASSGRTHRTWHALSDVKGHLRKSALKLLGYLVVAYLILRLIPTLNEALHSLQNVSWAWIAGAIVLEFLSETGFVIAWRQIVDPDRVLEADGRGWRMDQRVAWAQLGEDWWCRADRSAGWASEGGSFTASECRRTSSPSASSTSAF